MNWSEEIDDILAEIENTVKGEEGDKITEVRGIIQEQRKSGQVDTIVMPDDAPTNNLPTYEECALRVSNAEYLKENDLENDDFYHDALLPNPIHEFIYEYDCADKYKSAWWMRRLEKLIEYVKSEA